MKITATFTIDPKTSDPAAVIAVFADYLNVALDIGADDDVFSIDSVTVHPQAATRTVWVAGHDLPTAVENTMFDNPDTADAYADDHGATVWALDALVLPTTAETVTEPTAA